MIVSLGRGIRALLRVPPDMRSWRAPSCSYLLGLLEALGEYYGFVGTLDAEIRRDLDREIAQHATLDIRRSHAGTARLMESEARAARKAWVQSMDASDTARSETHNGVADALAEQEIQRNNNLNGDGSQGSGSGITRPVRPTRECTYTDFLKCQPMNFKGTEGVVGLTQWFERMETVFNISNCAVENQVKFATCTLHGVALTWWKSHVKTVGQDAAHGMPWNTLMKMMTELALMCGRMFPKEADKIEKYVGGLPDMIYGSVMASKPKTMQDAIEFATELMDKKISTLAERQAKNKRKLDNNNQAQQKPPKKQGLAIAYTARPGKRKEYAGTLPLCNKCKFHHNGQCTVKCANYKRVGHLTRDCRSPATTNNQRNPICYECGNQGHYRSDCPELKNQNHGK
ncbi:hypothetical protein Tco_0296681 [Tanacetum coccineum]